jgi:hypothetical protein
MEDERIIELTDDDGSTERFIFLTSIEHDARHFAIMTPEEESEGEEEEAIVILEMLDAANGEDMELVSVEDDALAEAVFNEYMAMLEEDDCDCDECDCDECAEEEEDGEGGDK